MSKTNECPKCKGKIGGAYDLNPMEYMCTCDRTMTTIPDIKLEKIGISFMCPACGELEEFSQDDLRPMVFLCKKCLEWIGKKRTEDIGIVMLR